VPKRLGVVYKGIWHMEFDDVQNKKFLAARCYDVTVSLHNRQVADFDQLVVIGMAVRLALHLRGVAAVPYDLLKQIGLYLLHIPPTSLGAVIELLADAEFVKVDRQGATIRAIVPTVPYYEDFFETMGDVAKDRQLSEPERLTIELVNRLAKSPAVKETLYNQTGAGKKLVDRMIEVGTNGGYLTARRARGRDIVLSPMYFPENAEMFADLVASSGSGRVGKVVQTLARNQGWPLRLIQEKKAVGETRLTEEELQIVSALASEGFTPPPAIRTSHRHCRN
jgi:hypothetical protein